MPVAPEGSAVGAETAPLVPSVSLESNLARTDLQEDGEGTAEPVDREVTAASEARDTKTAQRDSMATVAPAAMPVTAEEAVPVRQASMGRLAPTPRRRAVMVERARMARMVVVAATVAQRERPDLAATRARLALEGLEVRTVAPQAKGMVAAAVRAVRAVRAVTAPEVLTARRGVSPAKTARMAGPAEAVERAASAGRVELVGRVPIWAHRDAMAMEATAGMPLQAAMAVRAPKVQAESMVAMA